MMNQFFKPVFLIKISQRTLNIYSRKFDFKRNNSALKFLRISCKAINSKNSLSPPENRKKTVILFYNTQTAPRYVSATSNSPVNKSPRPL